MQILATELALSADRGPVYGPLTFEIDSGLSVLRGDPGSGRTSLLLTLGGRMKYDSGSLTVAGLGLPQELRAVQKISGIAGFTGIDELEESVTVGATLRERLAWLAPWWHIVRTPDDHRAAALCADVFGQESIPRADTLIWDLDEGHKFLLRLVLSLMSGPQLLLVDDPAQLHNEASRAAVWSALNRVAEHTAVVVSCASLDEQIWADLGMNPAVIELNQKMSEDH